MGQEREEGKARQRGWGGKGEGEGEGGEVEVPTMPATVPSYRQAGSLSASPGHCLMLQVIFHVCHLSPTSCPPATQGQLHQRRRENEEENMGGGRWW